MGRCAIASPGNDFRLGACEAPPAIVSTYLGDDMTGYLEAFMNGETAKYEPGSKTIDIGVDSVLPFNVPAEDRNRTSPLPCGSFPQRLHMVHLPPVRVRSTSDTGHDADGGKRFEFRAVGSSQNVSMVNTVLATGECL
jgi:glutamine synthetase